MSDGSGLGIVAGRGDLPRRIAETCRAEGRTYHVIALEGFAGAWTEGHPHTPASVLAVGRIVDALRAAGCGRLVLAGGVERPPLDPGAMDRRTLDWLPQLAPALRLGDDGLLSAVRHLFESEGFTLIEPHEVLDLRVGAGVLGRVAPSARNAADADRGEAILSALGPLDVGQACVVAGGRVLGIETIQGTDALLDFVARTRALAQGAAGGILVKRMKPGQDRGIDAPTIGLDTVAAAAGAGLEGIAIEADAVQIIDRDAAVAAADEAGLVLWARP